jgi:hypothetical protein
MEPSLPDAVLALEARFVGTVNSAQIMGIDNLSASQTAQAARERSIKMKAATPERPVRAFV